MAHSSNKSSTQGPGSGSLEIGQSFFELAESLPQVFWVRLPDLSRVIYVNPAYEKIWKRPRKDLYAGTANWLDSVYPLDKERLKKAVIQQARGPHQEEYRILQIDGTTRWIRDRSFPIRNAAGEVDRVAGTSEDITDGHVHEGEKVQAQKLEAIGQLAAGIAHELNTPIQFISDNIYFLQKSFNDLTQILFKLDSFLKEDLTSSEKEDLLMVMGQALRAADMEYVAAEIPKALEQSLEGVGRVKSIVQAIKEFSHPGPIEKTLVDINKAIQNTLTVTRNEWKYVAEVEARFDATLPLVSCMVGEFNQAILNILINAAHTIGDKVKQGAAKGLITVSTTHSQDWVEIRISDTGGGIPDEIRHKVFDPFFTTKEVGKGSGQGLSIARSVIVQKMGGRLVFETKMGQGTTFIIHLPLR